MGPRRRRRLAGGPSKPSEPSVTPHASADEVALPPELLFLVLEVLASRGWKISLLETSLCCKALYAVGLPLLYRVIVVGRGGVPFGELGALFGSPSSGTELQQVRLGAVRDLTIVGAGPEPTGDNGTALVSLLARARRATLDEPGMNEVVAFAQAASNRPGRIGADLLVLRDRELYPALPPDPQPAEATVRLRVSDDARLGLAAVGVAAPSLARIRIEFPGGAELADSFERSDFLKSKVTAVRTPSEELGSVLALGMPLDTINISGWGLPDGTTVDTLRVRGIRCLRVALLETSALLDLKGPGLEVIQFFNPISDLVSKAEREGVREKLTSYGVRIHFIFASGFWKENWEADGIGEEEFAFWRTVGGFSFQVFDSSDPEGAEEDADEEAAGEGDGVEPDDADGGDNAPAGGEVGE